MSRRFETMKCYGELPIRSAIPVAPQPGDRQRSRATGRDRPPLRSPVESNKRELYTGSHQNRQPELSTLPNPRQALTSEGVRPELAGSFCLFPARHPPMGPLDAKGYRDPPAVKPSSFGLSLPPHAQPSSHIACWGGDSPVRRS